MKFTCALVLIMNALAGVAQIPPGAVGPTQGPENGYAGLCRNGNGDGCHDWAKFLADRVAGIPGDAAAEAAIKREKELSECIGNRGDYLKKIELYCNGTDSSSADCEEATTMVNSELSVARCFSVAHHYAPPPSPPAPGCAGQVAVEARKDTWQAEIALEKGQSVTLDIPLFSDLTEQVWAVIDPDHRGQNTAVGNGVIAHDGFIAPDLQEGALLVRGSDLKIRSFTSPSGSMVVSVPGVLYFIANDNYKNNNRVFQPGFHGNGFDDNSGSITVRYYKYPCPMPPPPKVPPKPSPACNQRGGPQCCSIPAGPIYCGLVAQPYQFAGCAAENKNGPVSCEQFKCTDNEVENTLVPPTCFPSSPVWK